jgi:hypothetical protein
MTESKRHPVTEWRHLSKLTVEQFTSLIIAGTPNFSANMNNLEDIYCMAGEMYPEEWMEIFAKWLELYGVENKNPPPLNRFISVYKEMGSHPYPSSLVTSCIGTTYNYNEGTLTMTDEQ